jgi:hypothetical protein
MFNLIRSYLTARELMFDFALLVCLVFACVKPWWGNGVFSRIEVFGTRLARKKTVAIFTLAFLLVIVRLSLLAVIPVPVPHAHDEFSYLLAADTFAAKRLTNPPHPMWTYFDTIHVNQHPTYMSKFPPAQGAVLALGQILWHPWLGVVLSVGIMCGVTLWMLQGWLPPDWAFLGGVLVVLRVGIFSYWMNSYWGGAVPAIGGALVIGALPRIIHSLRTRDSVIMGVGALLLMNSRPYEGLILCIPAAGFLAFRLFGRRGRLGGLVVPRLILPFCAVAVLSLGFVGYYNWRGTGNAVVMPYAVNEQTYSSTPTLLWQKQRPPLRFNNPQFEEFYNGWSHELWMQSNGRNIRSLFAHGVSVLVKFTYFFMWPELCVPVIALIWVLRDRRVRFLTIEVGFCFVAFLLIAWFQPHYAAPVLTSVFVLLTQALRHLRHWQLAGRRVGVGLTRALLVFSLILAPFHPHTVALQRSNPSGIEYRAILEAQLESTPGNHLVIVRYAPGHAVLGEWVYNRADIDHSKVIWARDIPGLSLCPLLDYFASRQVWVVEPDSISPHVTPYLRE